MKLMSKLAYTGAALAAIGVLGFALWPAPSAPPRAELPGFAPTAPRTGDMQKLNFYSAAIPAPTTAFLDGAGNEVTLEQFRGQVVVLNFWATWCAPCRVEMPHLSALQADLGGDDLAVVAVAIPPSPPGAIDRFLGQIGVTNLEQYTSPNSALGRAMGVTGLPVTVLLDRAGNEVARMVGEADWNSPAAQAILQELMASGR